MDYSLIFGILGVLLIIQTIRLEWSKKEVRRRDVYERQLRELIVELQEKSAWR
jgi:hypothetical protein